MIPDHDTFLVAALLLAVFVVEMMPEARLELQAKLIPLFLAEILLASLLLAIGGLP